MKETIEKGIIPHLEGQISLHKANIEIYMKTPAGIGDHPCIMQAIEKELGEISKCQGMIDAWFSMKQPRNAHAI